MHFKDMGMVQGVGYTPSMTRNSRYPEEAYGLGKSLGKKQGAKQSLAPCFIYLPFDF